MRILIVDDDEALCRSLEIHFGREGHEVSTSFTGEAGMEAARSLSPDLIFLDVQLPDRNGLEVLRTLKGEALEGLIVMITGTQDARATVEAIRLGAFDYIRKPLDLDAILVILEKARQQSQNSSRDFIPIAHVNARQHEIVGSHLKTLEVLKQIGHLSTNSFPVLILGESGTGKELVARVLHESRSPELPFVAVNCSAIVPTLLESELFGHQKGAFTGAIETKKGRFELAGEGTIFLDEIGEMPMDLQVKLLRSIQERQFERVGGTTSIGLKARVVAATNQDLVKRVSEGKFREDLYYRLAVSTITAPPLRDRRSDIPLLVNHLLVDVCEDVEKSIKAIDEGALDLLTSYSWPGNIRELRNTLMRAVVLSTDKLITRELVEKSLPTTDDAFEIVEDAVRTLRDVEKRHVQRVLDSMDWNISHTASILDISRVTLRKKIEDYNLKPMSGIRTKRKIK